MQTKRFDDFQKQLGITRHLLTERLNRLVKYRIDLNNDTTLTTPRARPAISVSGTPNVISSTIGSNTTPTLIDLAILFK